MKFQIFADYSFQELNTIINDWLNAVPGLEICHVTQSQIYDAEKGALTTISVFYTETHLGGIRPAEVVGLGQGDFPAITPTSR